MTSAVKNSQIDIENTIDREINGCKVRLFFSLNPNKKTERFVLDNLMLVFDRKMSSHSFEKEKSNV